MTPDKIEARGRCQLLLPRIIYATPGQESNVYFDNIVLQARPRQYLFDVTCEEGIQHEDRWFWTPENEPGDYQLQIEVRNMEDEVLATSETIIHVAALNAGAGKDVKMLCIGDSLTAASIYTGELLRLCSGEDNPRLTLLGTRRGNSSDPENRHEGYSGWRYESFLTKWETEPAAEGQPLAPSSPFLFQENGTPTLNFARYLQEKLGGEIPDLITLMLGINDVFLATEETRWELIETMLSNARALVANIRATVPKAIIGVLPLVPPSTCQDSFGETNGTMQTRWGYLKNRSLANVALMQEFGNRETENIFIVPAHLNLDCEHSFPSIETTINARNESKRQLCNNEVHPSPEGYLQIADSIYGWIKFVSG